MKIHGSIRFLKAFKRNKVVIREDIFGLSFRLIQSDMICLSMLAEISIVLNDKLFEIVIINVNLIGN